MKHKCYNCGNKSLVWGLICPICDYNDGSYDDLPKDKHGSPVHTIHGRNYTTCSHCGEKVENWLRWSSDASPPDDWGKLTDISWLCKKCYKEYKKLLEDFTNPDVLETIKAEGYLSDELE